MKKFLPFVFIVAVVVVFARSFLLHNLLPIPSDTIVGLYHPFRDMYALSYPRGVPFKNFLITDPVRQQIPWKSLSISLEKNFQLPLWNPYSFSGAPLLANFQSGVFYPINILFFFLPFNIAWSLFILSQPLLGGLFMYWYLRNLKLHPIASLIGAVSFAFSGFAIVWLEWGNVFHTLLWVPLILLAKDKLIVQWTKKWMAVFFIAEVMAFFAGHLQVWFYTIVVTNSYLFLRVYQKTVASKTKKFVLQYAKTYIPFLLVGIAMYLMTAIQWVPTFQFIFASARNIDQNYLTTAGWFVPYQNLIQFLAPDFFGNPTTLNYWGIWNYAEFSGYIGILPLIFAFFAIVFRHDKKTWFWGTITLVAVLFALPTPLGILPYQLHIPFLSTSQPTRLLSIVDLALPIIAALGCDYFLKKKNWNILWVIGCIGIVFAGLWMVILKYHFGITPENILISKRNLLLPTGIFFFCSILVIFWRVAKSKKVIVALGLIAILLVTGDLLRFSDKFLPFTNPSYVFPQDKTLSYLQKNIGNNRYMTTDSRILAPNFSVMYRLQSVDGYDPLYLENYAQLIIASERNKPDIHVPFGFNRIITPHNYTSAIMNLLGVKYILSLDSISTPGYKKVFEEGQTKIYENTNALPRVFFVKQVLPVQSQQAALNQLFLQKNLQDVAIVEGITKDYRSRQGNAEIRKYTPNTVTIQTSNSAQGFLVLTDIYYPTWSVTIDTNPATIYQTDGALRGILVPKGNHVITFSDHLF